MSLPPPSVQYCEWHPKRQTGRYCTRCGRPACPDCLVQVSVGSHCPSCRKAAQPSVRTRAVHWNAGQHLLATRTLIALNVLVFVWTLTGGTGGLFMSNSVTRLQFDLGLFQPALAAGEWYRVVTSGFLHFGILHIGMNMLLLYQLGQLLEPALGRARFTLLYFAAMFGGAAGAILLTPNALTGGASGAVFGLMAAAAVGLQQRGINPFQTGIGATLVLNLVLTLSIPGISIGGHLGGVVAGAAVGYAMLEPRWQRDHKNIGIIAPVAAMVLSLVVMSLR